MALGISINQFLVILIHKINLFFFSFHPNLPLLATSSGQRKFLNKTRKNNVKKNLSDDESDSGDEENISNENSLKIWKYSL